MMAHSNGHLQSDKAFPGMGVEGAVHLSHMFMPFSDLLINSFIILGVVHMHNDFFHYPIHVLPFKTILQYGKKVLDTVAVNQPESLSDDSVSQYSGRVTFL